MENLDKKIIAVQKSTRTTFSCFNPLHNKLRAKFPWYYSWHVKSFANFAHKLVLLAYTLNIVAFVLFSSVLVYNKTATNIAMKAASEQTGLNTKTIWEAGTLDNIDTTSSVNQMKIADLSSSPIDLSNKTIAVTYDEANKASANDKNENTYWSVTDLIWPNNQSWTIDIGENYTVAKMKSLTSTSTTAWTNLIYSYSTDGTSFTPTADNYTVTTGTPAWDESADINATARYLRITFSGNDPDNSSDGYLYEFQAYGPGYATHTTAANQLDGGSNFLTWETFTPTQTVSDNATIQYRFRTSTDGSTWTAWTAYQSGTSFDLSKLVTNSVGTGEDITYYKYLQIEAKLTSLDGVSTPIITDYTVNHHTNRAPTAPAEPSAAL